MRMKFSQLLGSISGMLVNSILVNFLVNFSQPIFRKGNDYKNLKKVRLANYGQLTVELTTILCIVSQLVNFLLKPMTHKGVADKEELDALASKGVKEVVYMAGEIPLLKEINKEKLMVIHSVKKIFPGAGLA